jgi:hypothetical protein
MYQTLHRKLKIEQQVPTKIRCELVSLVFHKSLRIPKGYSEAVKHSQYNGKKRKKDKETNNDVQHTPQKTKDPSTQIPLKTGCY